MINESNLNEYYSVIANKLNKMITCRWESVYLYGEVLDDSREVYFYFKPTDENEFVYGHDIPDIYDVDEDTYDDTLFELMDVVADLNNEFVNAGDPVWTSIIFYMDSIGKFKADFSYEDILNSEFTSGERQIIWEYEVLGIEPEDEDAKELVKRYLKKCE